jgi:hypothetical protein
MRKEAPVKKLIITAMLAAFGAAVVLPAVAIVQSDSAFAKTTKKKVVHKPAKRATPKKTSM